jgi:hypothetical protein
VIARPACDRSCRECGCSENHACYRPDRGPCSWVAADLCSHCAQPWKHRLPAWLQVAFGALFGALLTLAILSSMAPPHRLFP